MFSKKSLHHLCFKTLGKNSYDCCAVTPYRTPWCCKGRSSNERPSASMIPQISPEASESDPEDSLIDSVVSPRTRATGRLYGWMWCVDLFCGENYTTKYISVGSHEILVEKPKNRFTKKKSFNNLDGCFCFFSFVGH